MERIRPRRCKCGCGRPVNPGKRFVKGHHGHPKKYNRPEKCKCGCGEWPTKGKTFIIGHHSRGQTISDKQKAAISKASKDRVMSERTKAKISAANTGKKRTLETRKKMSDSRMGFKPSKEAVARQVASRIGKYTGEKNHMWKGGNHKSYPILFYTAEFRHLIHKRDGSKCLNPLCRGNSNQYPLEFHHIDYNKENCITTNVIKVCKSCNSRANHGRSFWQDHYEGIMKRREHVT